MNSCGHGCFAAFGLLAALGLAVSAAAAEPGVRLITLDPGHFHAALIQKEMYPGVDPTVHVYAPLGPDLLAHLGRVSAFNRRAENPTSWRLEVHAGPDFLERMLREKPGNVVVLSGPQPRQDGPHPGVASRAASTSSPTSRGSSPPPTSRSSRGRSTSPSGRGSSPTTS